MSDRELGVKSEPVCKCETCGCGLKTEKAELAPLTKETAELVAEFAHREKS